MDFHRRRSQIKNGKDLDFLTINAPAENRTPDSMIKPVLPGSNWGLDNFTHSCRILFKTLPTELRTEVMCSTKKLSYRRKKSRAAVTLITYDYWSRTSLRLMGKAGIEPTHAEFQSAALPTELPAHTGAKGFEPLPNVLETFMLPLHQAPIDKGGIRTPVSCLRVAFKATAL